MGVIKIEQGNEFKIITNFIKRDDLFLNQYQIAAAHVEEIISPKYNDSHTPIDYLNNIIAFTGERGQGKSSAMLTFTEALEGKYKEIQFGDKTKEANFLKLDTIDPSTFENIHNIIEVIVARMFNKIKDKLKNMPKDGKYGEIIYIFQKVYECLSLIRNPKKLEELEYDYEGSIQKIAHIGDSTKLKEHMCELVEKYLEIMGEGNLDKSFLIIPIDDLDININHAYKMAEQIRKYLLIPKIIIIMAVKVEQLKYCVELQYRKELDLLIRADERLNKQEPLNMATKYIEKLIPDGRKISLPELKILASNDNDKTEIEYLKKSKKKDGDIQQINILEKYKGLGIEKTILGYLYEKTGLIFVKPKNNVHPLVPNTLRELVNFISVLGKMDDNKSLNNIYMFENFMLNTWIPSNLDDGYIKIIRNFYSGHDLAMHYVLCPMLLNILDNFKIYTLYKKEQDEFDQLKTRFANKNSSDYSLGDVLSLLNFIEKRFSDSEIRLFVFSIKTLYSIKMKKMVLENRHTDKTKAKDIYRFVNGDILGYEIERRTNATIRTRQYAAFNKRITQVIRSNANLNTPRAVFKYDIDQLFASELSKTVNLSVKRLSNEQVDLILDVLFFSNFNQFDIFVSDNANYRKEAEFSIDNLLISSLDIDSLLNKWGYQPDERIKESISSLKSYLNIKAITDIVSNIELCEYIWKYCKDNRELRESASDVEHFRQFLVNVEKAINSKNLNYLFIEKNRSIFLNEEGFNWATNFYIKCFNALSEVTNNKIKRTPLIRDAKVKNEKNSLKAELEEIKQLSKVCIPSTLISKINKVINLLNNAHYQQFDEEIRVRLNKLNDECMVFNESLPSVKIPTHMKEEYNSIYKNIHILLNT